MFKLQKRAEFSVSSFLYFEAIIWIRYLAELHNKRFALDETSRLIVQPEKRQTAQKSRRV